MMPEVFAMCPCLKIGKLALVALAPAAVMAILAVQFQAPAADAPPAPSGVLLSELREPASKPTATPAGNAGEQLIVDMNNWSETSGSGIRR